MRSMIASPNDGTYWMVIYGLATNDCIGEQPRSAAMRDRHNVGLGPADGCLLG